MANELIITGQTVWVERIGSMFGECVVEMKVTKHNNTSFYVNDGTRNYDIRMNQKRRTGSGSLWGFSYRVWTSLEERQKVMDLAEAARQHKRALKVVTDEIAALVGQLGEIEDAEKVRDYVSKLIREKKKKNS